MNKIAVGMFGALALGATACSTAALGAAPAKDGSIYVVGQKQGFLSTEPAMWECPAQPGKGSCKQLNVEEVSK